MQTRVKPIVFISTCLTFAPVRYNGQMISSELVERLKPFITPITHCPEFEIGLGVPRSPVRIIARGGDLDDLRLIQPATGLDLTDRMREYADRVLAAVKKQGVDGFLMKAKSPSSGVYDVKIYPAAAGAAALTRKGAGMFGGRVRELFPNVAVEDEGRLQDDRLRDNFLKRIFTSAAFRQVRNSGRAADLVRFHAENKFLFMSYNQTVMREMGKVTASLKKPHLARAWGEYADLLVRLMAAPYRPSNLVNALEHAFGFFKQKLSTGEKSHFLSELDKYRRGQTFVAAAVALLTSYIIRFEEPYLMNQTLFHAYPEEIVLPGAKTARRRI